MRGRRWVSMTVAVAAACSPGGPTEPPGGENGEPRVVGGRVHPVGGGGLPALRVVWRPADGGPSDTAEVAGDGSFELALTGAAARGDLLVDGPEPRAFHPFLFPFDMDSLGGALDLVLVPRRWTVRRGAYAGQVVETPLDPVVDDEASQTRYTYWFAQPEPFADPVRYALELQSWPRDHLPARVAFDRGDPPAAVAPGDSAAIWSVLDRMEALFGLDLFEPAVPEPGWWPDPPTFTPDDLVPGAIRVLYDPPRTFWGGEGFGEGGGSEWQGDLGAWAAGSRFTRFRVRRTWLAGGNLLVGELDSLRLGDGFQPWETVLMHEMLHVLGAGHTFRIPSPQGPRMRTLEPSPHDVAYLELLRETMRLEEELDTFLGILPALVGERVVLLGRPALPSLDGSGG